MRIRQFAAAALWLFGLGLGLGLGRELVLVRVPELGAAAVQVGLALLAPAVY